jgi:energy coupling factor transporter S component ThiW
VLSFVPGSIPVAGAKVLPWQHMTNVVAGVMLGPWYAALAATVAALLRNLFGVGTLLAFPGGIPGAIVVGLAYRLVRKPWAGLLEPLGTGPIGATLGALVVSPLFMHRTTSLPALLIAFLASSIPGALLGYLVLQALTRVGVVQAMAPRGARWTP